MKIGLTVDGKPFDLNSAKKWAYHETGVLHGTYMLGGALADALHKETGDADRALLNEKGLREFIKIITAQAMVGVYTRGCLLLEQIENPERRQKLGELLVECYPARGFSPAEDSLRGHEVSPLPQEWLLASMDELTAFEKAEDAVMSLMQEWVEEDHAEGRYDTAVLAEEFDIVV